MKYFFLFILAILSTLPLYSQVWIGGVSSNVATAQNWNNNAAPNSSSSLMFQSSLNTTIYFNWPTATSQINGITFNGGSSDYTFNGSNNTNLSTGDIYNNQSGSIQTFNIGLNFKNNSNIRTNGDIVFNNTIAAQGAGKVNFDGSGEFKFGNDNIVASNVQLTLMNGADLDLGGTSQSFGNLLITGHSVIDFAGGGSLDLNNLNIQDGGYLTILNWNPQAHISVDYQPSNAVISRINFEGYGSGFYSFDSFITPVPEPSTYGFILVGSFIGLYLMRRRVRA